ncbi:MAG: crosslink repair DNA glycosylase YcaQ family protein [bacterium]
MIIQSKKVLRYYLYKQLLSSPTPRDLNLLDIIDRAGFPKEQNASLSFYLRKENFEQNELLEALTKNEIIEVKTFKNKRLIVPKDLARDFIKFIPQKNHSDTVKSCAKFIFQDLKKEPKTQSQILRNFAEYAIEIKKHAIDYLESQGKILRIYNFADKKFEFVLTQEILGPDLYQKLDVQILAKIIHLTIQYYGPLRISDLVKYSGINSIEIQKAFKYIRNKVASIKIDSSLTPYLIDGKDLANLQVHKSPSIDFINILPKSDHALSISQDWLYKSIPLYGKLNLLVIFNGEVVGGFSDMGGFDNFVLLPKLVLNEISNKHTTLLQWMKRKLI